MKSDIVDVARQQGLQINPRTLHHEEVLCKCPFCHEDSKPQKKRRYYLSLNSRDQVFKCWFCGESGGVLRFISLLEGVPEEQIKKRYRKRKIVHPAERLSRNQRKWLRLFMDSVGVQEPDWKLMRKRDFAYYLRTMDLLWQQWQAFLEKELQDAYFWLVLGISTGRYQKFIERIRKREKEIEAPLLKHVLQIYSCSSRPKWTEEVERFVHILDHPISPEPETAGMEMEE